MPRWGGESQHMGAGAGRAVQGQHPMRGAGTPALPCHWLVGSLEGCLPLPTASLGHCAGAHHRRARLNWLAATAGLADAELRVGRVPNLA